jgi:hypothetical protein
MVMAVYLVTCILSERGPAKQDKIATGMIPDALREGVQIKK